LAFGLWAFGVWLLACGMGLSDLSPLSF